MHHTSASRRADDAQPASQTILMLQCPLRDTSPVFNPPLGGAEGKSSPRTSFMRNLPPSYGVPAAHAGATQATEMCSEMSTRRSYQRSDAAVHSVLSMHLSQRQWTEHAK
jgi:hypothetical protein